MENTYQTQPQNQDIFTEQPRKGLPGMLNVLTILTFIGCLISYIFTITGFFSNSDVEGQKAKIEDAMETAGDNEMAAKMLEGSTEMIQKAYDYRYILLISGLLFTTLCVIGAMQMRKLKKSGYPIYVVGELAPIILSLILIGFGTFMVKMMTIGSLVFALLFVILYTTQRKHLVN